jgi:thiamine monophosphate synthase
MNKIQFNCKIRQPREPENLGDVLAAGAKRVCVVSAILNAPDVTKACAEFREKLN